MAGARALLGGCEVNVLPETLGQEHAKIHVYVLPVVCWVPVVFGERARRGAALGGIEAVGKAQPHLCGEDLLGWSRCAGQASARAGPCHVLGAKVLL